MRIIAIALAIVMASTFSMPAFAVKEGIPKRRSGAGTRMTSETIYKPLRDSETGELYQF